MGLPAKSEKAIFATALKCGTAAGRAAYLDEACAGDPALRERLEELLRPIDAAATWVDPAFVRAHAAPRPEQIAATVETDSPQGVAPGEVSGTRIGRYKLIQQIGEGGCGTVFLAEQEEPVRRRVALKIIKLGMDTKAVVARFEAERQALALMSHPNIAKVLDAGTTDSGRPFFVMELVTGQPITKYCDERHLNTEARLRIFTDVCAAVQHAHQKGIIHRDLKPSNILVTVRDDRPAPMVIDFGIAKAIEQKLTDKTLFTTVEQMLGTPAYMSPEQAGLGNLDIDTRSDIYSLGVLLYELLTGRPPFDPKALFKSGLEEIRRIIREDEPPWPSTRLSTLQGDDLTMLSRDHKVDPQDLAVVLRGDLDWVVMKCLEKDRTRRYDTASSLAADLEHHLNHEPVTARPPSLGYQLHKFIRRNRRSVAAIGTITGLLVVGLGITAWLAVVATRARNAAKREAVRSAEVARFLKDMLEGAGPARARGRDTALLREILDTTSRRVGTDLKTQPDIEFELSATIGRTYMALGTLAEAEAMQRAAVDLARRVYGPNHTNLVIALDELGWTLRESSRFSDSTNVLGQALSLSQRLVGDGHALTAGIQHRLGSVYADLGQFAEAERLTVRATDILSRQLGPQHLRTLQARQNLAALYYQEQKLIALEPLALSTATDAINALGEDHPETLKIKALLAVLRQDQGRFEEAEKLHTEILASKQRVLGDEHPSTLISMDNLGIVYAFQGRFAEAEAITRTAATTYDRLGLTQNRRALALLGNHAEYLRNLGRHDEAEAEFQKIIATAARLAPESDPYLLETRNSLAILRELQGRKDAAEALVRDIVRIRRSHLPPNDLTLAESLGHLAEILLGLGRTTEAEALARESLAISEPQRSDDWRCFALRSLIGACRLAANDPVQAEPLLRQAQAGLKARLTRIPALDQARFRESLDQLSQLGTHQGNPAEAAQWRLQLADFDKTAAGQRLLMAQGLPPER